MRHITLGRLSMLIGVAARGRRPARSGGAGRAQAARGGDHSRSQVAGGGGGRRPRRGGQPHPRHAELPRGRGATQHDAQAAARRRRRRERPRPRRVGRRGHRGLQQPRDHSRGRAGGSRSPGGSRSWRCPPRASTGRWATCIRGGTRTSRWTRAWRRRSRRTSWTAWRGSPRNPGAAFEQNRKAFLTQLEQRMAQWTKAMEPVRGSKVVVYHPDFIYLLTRFGLQQAGTVEDRPGIPPSPQHLVEPDPTDEGGEDQGDPGRAVERHQAGQSGSPRRRGPRPS